MAVHGSIREPVFLGRDPGVRRLLATAELVAATEAPVLLTGESGTGKELLAELLHRRSPRADGPFVAVNCGAIASGLAESELFGHVAGAFTGAVGRKQGKFEAAQGGTLFLDEVAEMPPALQVKLLRVLAGGEYSPVGLATARRSDVRVVAATNQDLPVAMADGRFRPELYYRLNVFRLELPPLRERPGDVLLLAEHFLARWAGRYERPRPRLSPELEARLLAYPYPGNVRELDNLMHRAAVLARGGAVGADLLPELGDAAGGGDEAAADDDFHSAKQRAVERFERDYLTRTLRQSAGVVSRAAGLAGLSERNFHEKLNRYGIDGRSFRPSPRAGSAGA